MDQEERQTRDTYKYQIDLIANFVRQVMYHRAVGEVIKDFNQNYWIYTFNNCMEMAVLGWCKLFGANAEHLHWSKIFSDKETFRRHILDSVEMTKEEWNEYWQELRDYRNEWVSHYNPDFRPDRHPSLEPALRATIACYQHLLEKLEQYSIHYEYPSSLKEYIDRFFNQALLLVEKAYLATKDLGENVY